MAATQGVTRVRIIAEAGVNHNGDIDMARALVKAAAGAGADAVKFQTFRAEALASPSAQKAAYVAAKHGVIGFTKAAALDHAAQGVRINAVAPGFIETPLLRHLDEEKKLAAAALHPMNRLGMPAEITDVIVFLLSDSASFVTGACFTADGGYLAQ